MVDLDTVIIRRARDAVHVLMRLARVRAAYIFGSLTSGTADTFSDIDIAAFVEGLEQWDFRSRARAVANVQREAGDDVEIHFFRAEDLTDPPTASFASYVLRHGIQILSSEEKMR
jgi:predicted nucleotidyltransferase